MPVGRPADCTSLKRVAPTCMRHAEGPNPALSSRNGYNALPILESLVVSLTTMTFAIAIFGALSLLGDRTHRQTGWGLVLFLLVAAYDALAGMIGLWGLIPQLYWFGAIEPLVTILYGPAIYLYVLRLTGQDLHPTLAKLLLAGLLLYVLAYGVTVRSIPREVQIDMLLGNPIRDPSVATRALAIMGVMQAVFLCVTFGFVVACWRALDDNLRRMRNLFSSIEDRTLSWLRVVMILIFLAWTWAALHGLSERVGLGGGLLEAVDAAITLSWVSMLAYFGIRQRPVLQDKLPVSGEAHQPGEKYARSALDGERMQKLGNRMVQLMRAEALHRDPTLSLRRLSERVGASPNHVSQTLNDHLGVSFFDFVNGFRVDEAERLLRDTDRSVTEIALDVGFNSRSTFNTAVRKHRSLTPTDLRRRG